MALTRPKYSQIYDTDWKQSVELATTADVGNLVLANVQPNSIDGITVLTNYRILVKDQDSGAQNGIYLVRDAGTGSNGWWERSLDAAQSSFVTAGMSVNVVSGTINGGKEFKLTTPDPIILGNTTLTFINPFASAGAGGGNAQIQFNDSSILGGSSALTFNKYSNVLTVSGFINATGNVSASALTAATLSTRALYGNIHLTQYASLFVQGNDLQGTSVMQLSTTALSDGMGMLGSTGLSSVLYSSRGINFRTGVTVRDQDTPTGGTTGVAIDTAGNLVVRHILPSANITYDLGSPTQKFRSAYFSGNTVYIGPESISVDGSGTWTFTSNGGNATMSSSSAMGNIYMDKTNGFMGFNDTSPDFLYDFNAPANGGELLHIETGVGTQAWFGAQNYGGLRYAAGVDQDYIFSGSRDRPDHYVLMTAGIVRANIHGNTGNVIFSNSISVTQDVSTKYLGTQEFRATSSNITVRSDVTLLGTKLFGAGQLAIGTEDIGAEKLFVTGGDTYLDGDVTITGNLFVNGNTTTFNANNLSISDSMIYLADDNPADTLDIGIVSAFTDAVRYQHTGFVRDATDRTWKLFANVEAEPTTTIDFTGATYANLLVGNVSATYFTGNGALLTGIASGGFAGNTSIYVSGNVTAINNGGTNGVGNIGAAGAAFNTVFAKATTAQYADLAEVYTSDKNYVPGTVLIFGGDQEVTMSTKSHDPCIAGVVSTNPAYLMNDTETGVAVALTGRVPCQVLGPVVKGDRLVASQWPGIAQKLNPNLYEPGCIIGKALRSIKESSVEIIEVVVGRL